MGPLPHHFLLRLWRSGRGLIWSPATTCVPARRPGSAPGRTKAEGRAGTLRGDQSARQCLSAAEWGQGASVEALPCAIPLSTAVCPRAGAAERAAGGTLWAAAAAAGRAHHRGGAGPSRALRGVPGVPAAGPVAGAPPPTPLVRASWVCAVDPSTAWLAADNAVPCSAHAGPASHNVASSLFFCCRSADQGSTVECGFKYTSWTCSVCMDVEAGFQILRTRQACSERSSWL